MSVYFKEHVTYFADWAGISILGGAAKTPVVGTVQSKNGASAGGCSCPWKARYGRAFEAPEPMTVHYLGA